jgi:flagellar FliL protein
MADEGKEKKDKAETSPASQPVAGRKSPIKIIGIIVLAGLLIGGGTAVTLMLLKGGDDATVAPEAVKSKKKPAKPALLGPIIPLDSFIVNLAGAGGRNYLKIDISLELSDPAVQQEIANKLPKIRDAILLILSTKTFDDVKTSQGKMLLKEDILMRINDALTSGSVENLYFTSFVVQ